MPTSSPKGRGKLKKGGLPVEADYKDLPTEKLAEILKNDLTTEELVEAISMDPLVYSQFEDEKGPSGAGGESSLSSPSSSSSPSSASSGREKSSQSSLKTPPSVVKYLDKFDAKECKRSSSKRYSVEKMSKVLISAGYLSQVEQYKTFPAKSQRINLCALLSRMKKGKRGEYSRSDSSVVLKKAGSATRSSGSRARSAATKINKAAKRRLFVEKLKRATEKKKRDAEEARKKKIAAKAAKAPLPLPKKKKAAQPPPPKKKRTPTPSSSSSSGAKKKLIKSMSRGYISKVVQKAGSCDGINVTKRMIREYITKKTRYREDVVKRLSPSSQELAVMFQEECAKLKSPSRSSSSVSSSSLPTKTSTGASSSVSSSSLPTKTSSSSKKKKVVAAAAKGKGGAAAKKGVSPGAAKRVKKRIKEIGGDLNKFKVVDLRNMARSIGAVQSNKVKSEIITNIKNKLKEFE